MVALLGKIQRGLQPRAQLEQRGVDLADPRGQRAFELIEGGTRLQRRDRIDQILHRLGLHQIEPAVQVARET